MSGPVRVGFVGLGQIYELCAPAYRDEPDVEVVALCDRDADRRASREGDWPGAAIDADLETFLARDLDLVEILVPTPRHHEVALQVLRAGFHVNLQKPITSTLEQADELLAAADAAGVTLRVMEDYLFYEPLVRLKELVERGDIGEPAGVHMKMIASGRGGWDIGPSSWVWQVEQAMSGRGIMMFDDGWHKFAVARWLFGPISSVWSWIGATDVGGGFVVDAPSTVVWEHTNGIRGVLDVTFAPDMLHRSDYYSCDERVEITGASGFARVNGISAPAVGAAPLEVYRDGELTGDRSLDATPPSAFRRSARQMLDHLLTGTPAKDELLLDARGAREVLRFVDAIYESSAIGARVELSASS